MGLVIADEEFIRGRLRILDVSNELLEIITAYKIIIDNLLKEGINDILINNALVEKTDALYSCINHVINATDSIVIHTGNFITEIDEADSYLYD